MLKRIRFFVSLVIFGLIAFCDWVKSVVKIKMGTIIDNTDEEKRDLNDSGCVQDESQQQKMAEEVSGVNLLDLSDDVLLYILKHCTPRDLKALSFSCPRFGRLVRERSLWRYVDARSERCCIERLDWYVSRTLHSDTRQLYVRGYAGESSGCLGILNCNREDADQEMFDHHTTKVEAAAAALQSNGTAGLRTANIQRHHACLYISAHGGPGLPRYRGTPLWSDEEGSCRPVEEAGECFGPRFTVCEPLLKQMRARCVRMTRLVLEQCNLNCNTTNLGHLPPSLTSLSLRGARCYNLPMDKSFLFKIHDHLPLLESLDVSECEWLEPASLLPLSKHMRLRELLMRDCHKMGEFVAYASLSSRYGFRSLQVLDLRGSPVGDSEVAPLAWLPRLQELRLSATTRTPPTKHGHYKDDAVAPRVSLEPWETQEPDYFKEEQYPEDGSDYYKMDVDGFGPRQSGENTDNDDDGDNNDDDNMNGGSGGIRKPDPCEPSGSGVQAKSSKSKRDTPTTKRKAENGGGDAGVNGDQSSSKRKKDDKNDGSSSDEDSANNSEEEMYEKRRCQTIVIVDRRYISDNEDPAFVRLPRRCPVAVTLERSRVSEARSNERGNNGREARNENAEAESQGDKKCDSDKVKDGKDNDGGEDKNDKADKVIEIHNEDDTINIESDDDNVKDESAKSNRGKKSKVHSKKDEPTNDKSKSDKDNKNASNESDNVKSITKCKRILRSNSKSVVNQGASTSKQVPVNNNDDNRDNNETQNERADGNRDGNDPDEDFMFVRRDERDGVLLDLVRRTERRRETPQQERVVRFNSYNIRHEVIDNQQIFNVEIERCAMHDERARANQRPHDENARAPGERNPPGNHPQPPPRANQQERQERLAEFQEALNAMQRQAAERVRLRERNPNIMNLIRGGEPEMPQPIELPPPLWRNLDGEPRHRVLYVNVGQPANALGPLPNFIQGLVSHREDRILNLSRSHLNTGSLVTDAAVRRFGRAAGNEIRFVMVGIPYPVLNDVNNDGSARPDRSNLRVLVMNGYRNITDRSLVHLAAAAPHLTLLDFRETNVTAQGVEIFKSLRPDCQVLFSPYVERKVEWPDEHN